MMARRPQNSAVFALCCAAALLSQAIAFRAPLSRTRAIDFTLLSQKSQPMDLRSESQTSVTDDFLYMPKDMGDIIRPQMLVPKWGVIDRLTRIPAAVRKSSFNTQDKPTPEQGHMNELNEEKLWVQLVPKEGAKEEAVETKTKIVQRPSVTIYDSTARSAVKAMGWRITAGVVTAMSSLFFTGGNWRVALSMVGSDFASKSITMFIGERLWNRSNIGRDAKKGESAMRSVMKAVAWRIFAVVNTLVMGIFFAGSVSVASKIASTDAVVKTGLMVVYERIWNRIRWGRIENVDGAGI